MKNLKHLMTALAATLGLSPSGTARAQEPPAPADVSASCRIAYGPTMMEDDNKTIAERVGLYFDFNWETLSILRNQGYGSWKFSDPVLTPAEKSAIQRMGEIAKIACNPKKALVDVSVSPYSCSIEEKRMVVGKDSYYADYDFDRGSLAISISSYEPGVGQVMKSRSTYLFNQLSDADRARAARLEDLMGACALPKRRLAPATDLITSPLVMKND